jgi:hypothetical protein
MPQSDSHVETNELPAELDEALDAALEKSGVDHKALAAAEERRAADLIAQSRAAQEEPAKAPPAEDESLVQVMAQGREHLLQKMREHAARAQAKKEEHKPPPMTERQRQNLLEEQAAGQRARERHEAELASRPPPPAKEKWDGTNSPVHRPGDIVPDPTLPAASFAAGTKQYSPDV